MGRDRLLVWLTDERAKRPTRMTEDSTGYDLFAMGNNVVPKRGIAMVDTGVRIRMPRGVYGRIAPRSGMAAYHGIDVGGGVIDQDYCGPLMVILFNHSEVDYNIYPGNRVAQLILEKYKKLELRVMEKEEESDEEYVFARGQSGLGSTGK